MASSDPSRISPTALYTSDVWVRNGMSHPALGSLKGRFLHAVLAPANLAVLGLGERPNLDQLLLARHRVLDHLLELDIAAGRVRQVVEIAAGLSPRGFRVAQLAATLERGAGTAILTEGLLGYFDLPTVEGMWRRFARALRALGGGVYLSDLNIAADATVAAKLFRRALSWFARGEVFLHFD